MAMTDPTPNQAVRDAAVRELLLGYLQRVKGLLWPGADGLTLEDLVRSYPQIAATGRVPTLQELHRQHPELADLLNAIFHQGS
jgi:hypothetical protein